MYDPFKKRKWHLAHGRTLELGPCAVLMGILNVTPDSFSDGGRFASVDAAIAQAKRMIGQGAGVIDVGGESTRPGATPISGEEERARILPVVAALAEQTDAILSVDTYRTETAEAALSAGAHIINDVWGLQKDADMASVAAKHGAGICIMQTSREREPLLDAIMDQYAFLKRSLKIAKSAGLKKKQIVLDPGIGFGKDGAINLELLDRLEELHALKRPLLIGTSRKRFIAAIAGDNEAAKDSVTAATSVVARMQGAAIFRVHNVAANRLALDTADAILART